MTARKTFLAVVVLPSLLAAPVRAQESISFRNDVMAVLARAGCNQGACHGNLNGKGGFKLSLRGQDPEIDFATITRGMQGRRINPNQPESSLLLLKATGLVPHEGGLRFPARSGEYELLRQWIATGARADASNAPRLKKLIVRDTERFLIEPCLETTIKADAFFDDGTRRDVTALVCFESTNPAIAVAPDGTVRTSRPGETTVVIRYLDQQTTVRLAFVPQRAGFVWASPAPVNFIDQHIFARLQKLRMNPAELCSDAVFIRRASLDIAGQLPSADEVRRFLDDPRPDRRARLIDDLLERPEYADAWALKWSDLLRNEEKQLDRKGVRVFHGWIRNALATNKPLNTFASELIAGRGSSYSDAPANYYRALRDPQVRAEATAQVFLGIRMQCAKCHNHPFDQWTQTDYHRWTAFFSRIQYRVLENKRKDNLDSHEFDGEQIVWIDRVGEHLHPVSRQPLQPAFLGASLQPLAPDADRLQVLATWVADEQNPFFARAQVNRVWNYLMGHGIVDPEDDFRLANPPSNPELLDALAKDFSAHRFDLKHLIRTIANSRTYQLSAHPNETCADDMIHFSHSAVRPLQAEQLLDGITRVTGVELKWEGFPQGTRAGQLPGVGLPSRKGGGITEPDRFMRMFGKPERLLNCGCERSEDATLGQALQMMTGRLLHKAITDPNNRLGVLLASGKTNADILEEIYLMALARRPAQQESVALLRRVTASADRRSAWEDVLWAVLNSKEFLLRQ